MTAAVPTPIWSFARVAGQCRLRRISGTTTALPAAMPPNTEASIVVKAYVVAGRMSTRRRNQITSRARDVRPEMPNTTNTAMRVRSS